jgi:DNA-binding XRE family transcriptional regulator
MQTVYRNSREHSGLTREAAGILIPASRSTMRRWETGEIIPPPWVINRMAVIYHDPMLPLEHCKLFYNLPSIIDGLVDKKDREVTG